ncbi:PPOX class F420-dependent enzyme [Ktedonobacteria bacterium brp13]|nr:PPOX class F420-dependent enzyme [Ktedonobacteria bacterium brp13]
MPENTQISAECRKFLLEEARTGKLATVRADGRPHIAPIWFDLEGNTIVFNTGTDSVKARNIRHDKRVSFCVDDEKPPFSFAIIDGTAELVDDQEHLLAWATRLAGRYMGQARAAEYGKRNAVPGELIVRITPTKIRFAKDIAN